MPPSSDADFGRSVSRFAAIGEDVTAGRSPIIANHNWSPDVNASTPDPHPLAAVKENGEQMNRDVPALVAEFQAIGDSCLRRIASTSWRDLSETPWDMETRISPVLITFTLVCFALVQNTLAVSPAPDGGYPGANTAEGTDALLNLTTGVQNTAVGFLFLKSDPPRSYKTPLRIHTPPTPQSHQKPPTR